MEEKLFFYYTNDLHSHFENWSKIVGYFNKKKIQRKRAEQAFWLIDIGDHVDRSHPISEAMMGKANVDLLNKAEYDIVTIGNNEGITLDYNDLFHLYDQAKFQVVCANLTSMNDSNPVWLKENFQFKSPSGITIGFVGLTAPFNAFYNKLGWRVESPYDFLDAHIKKVANESDIVILLSHLGINEDEEIARRYPEVDAIIGGHTHHLFRDGEYINDTLLTAAGKHGKFVGEVILTWDHTAKRLIRKEGYTTNIAQFEKEKDTESQVKQYQSEANHILDKTVVTLREPLEVGWFNNTLLMSKLVETLMEWTNADCAMLNAGVILDRLESGKVSYGDVHRICPHPINPCLVEIKGIELLEVIRGSYTKRVMELRLKGFGFRGEVIGRMIYSGLEINVTERSDGEYHVSEVTMNGNPIVDDKIYRVATADMFTFGRLLPEIARSKSKQFFMPEFLRDLLVHTLRTKIN